MARSGPPSDAGGGEFCFQRYIASSEAGGALVGAPGYVVGWGEGRREGLFCLLSAGVRHGAILVPTRARNRLVRRLEDVVRRDLVST